MLKKINQYVQLHNMIEKGDRVILGLSGGADSVCLFFVLLQLKKQIDFEIEVVHIHHGLRKEAEEEVGFVKRLCEKQQVKCHVFEENVKEIAKSNKQGVEEAGREVRKKCFEKVAQMTENAKIALAHHQNDNAETFLMNLARGSGLDGLGGIRAVNQNIIRPLLCVSRKEIEAYLKKETYSFCEDETNKEDMYTRNRVRNHILPMLEVYVNTETVSHIDSAAKELMEIKKYLDIEIETGYENVVSTENKQIMIDEEKIKKMQEVLKRGILRKALIDTARHEKDIERKHIELLEGLFEKQTGKSIDLPYEVKATRTYKGITLKKKENSTHFEMGEMHLPIDKKKSMIYHTWEVEWEVVSSTLKEQEPPSEKAYTKWFDYDIINDKVHIRTRKSGDYLTIDGKGSRQKLKSFFINEKIPKEIRDIIPVIAEGSHVLWVVGYRMSKQYQICQDTKNILKIKINQTEE